MYSKILGTGSYVPSCVRSNADLEKMVETSDEWITERTGIKERRIAQNETVSDMAYKAALNAIEASGIAIASIAAQYFDVPVLFAKKAKSQNLGDDLYTSVVRSYTYGKDYTITVSKKFIGSDDHVLIIDDFLAVGSAMKGLIDVCDQAGATVEGIGIMVEKGFQDGGKYLRENGYNLHSLAIIESMDDCKITFREQ